MSEGRFSEMALAVFPEPVAIVDGALSVLQSNAAWGEAFGRGAGPLEAPAVAEAVRCALAEGRAEVTLPASRDVPVGHALQIVRLPEGEPRAALVHARPLPHDLIDRARADRELREQQAFMREIIDCDPNLIFVKDGAGNFLLANKAVADLFGKTVEEIVGAHEHAMHDESDKDIADSFLTIDQQVIRTRQEISLEERVRSVKGEERWYFTTKRPLVRPSGAVHVLGYAVDITARRETQQQLQEAAAEVERRAAEAWRQAEAKAALVQELDQKLGIIEAQHQEILRLSAPLLDVAADVLAVPIVGAMSEARAEEIMGRILDAIDERKVASVIVDLTGLESIETRTADHLLQIVKAIQLLGAEAVITGIRPAVAQTIVALGIDLSQLTTVRTLRAALSRIAIRQRAS